MKKYSKINLTKEAEKLEMQGKMLSDTEQFWAESIQMLISEYTYLKNKLINQWDEKTSERMSQLEKYIEHLQKKQTFEEKEILKYQKHCQDFKKIQEKIKLLEFNKNLKKINKLFEK